MPVEPAPMPSLPPTGADLESLVDLGLAEPPPVPSPDPPPPPQLPD